MKDSSERSWPERKIRRGESYWTKTFEDYRRVASAAEDCYTRYTFYFNAPSGEVMTYSRIFSPAENSRRGRAIALRADRRAFRFYVRNAK